MARRWRLAHAQRWHQGENGSTCTRPRLYNNRSRRGTDQAGRTAGNGKAAFQLARSLLRCRMTRLWYNHIDADGMNARPCCSGRTQGAGTSTHVGAPGHYGEESLPPLASAQLPVTITTGGLRARPRTCESDRNLDVSFCSRIAIVNHTSHAEELTDLFVDGPLDERAGHIAINAAFRPPEEFCPESAARRRAHLPQAIPSVLRSAIRLWYNPISLPPEPCPWP
jgi:hypothetical protein